jgi:hypothetical protein
VESVHSKSKSEQAARAAQASARTREIAREVLVEAFGASATPFVPVPFVDDWMLARLLRRIAGKVLVRHGLDVETLPRIITDAYVKDGASPLAQSILVGAARFVVRKVAVVLDVKKSYDVFGESIAFALAIDVGAESGWAHPLGGARLGAAVHRAMQQVGSGTIEALVRAGREAYTGSEVQLGDAIGREIDKIRAQLEPVLRRELTGR